VLKALEIYKAPVKEITVAGYKCDRAILEHKQGKIEITVASSNSPGYDIAVYSREILPQVKPHYAIMTGIMAGNPNKVKLGDVILSTAAVTFQGKLADPIDNTKLDSHLSSSLHKKLQSFLEPHFNETLVARISKLAGEKIIPVVSRRIRLLARLRQKELVPLVEWPSFRKEDFPNITEGKEQQKKLGQDGYLLVDVRNSKSLLLARNNLLYRSRTKVPDLAPTWDNW